MLDAMAGLKVGHKEIKDQLDPYVQKTNSSPLGHKSNQALLELC